LSFNSEITKSDYFILINIIVNISSVKTCTASQIINKKILKKRFLCEILKDQSSLEKSIVPKTIMHVSSIMTIQNFCQSK